MPKPHSVRWKSIALKDERRLTAGLVHHRWPAFSRDGRWLAFAAVGGFDATWVVTDRRGRVARTFDGSAEGGASFSEDGALAFGRRAGRASEIWLTPGAGPTAGGPSGAPAVRLLGGDGKLYREPAWSPLKAELVYACADDEKGTSHLELLDVASGQRRALPREAGRVGGRPAWSPDGSLLYFEAAEGGDVGVWAFDPAQNELSRVTPTGSLSRRPAPLTRDLVIVERLVDGATHLVLIDRHTLRERDLTPSGDEQREPTVLRTKAGKCKLAYVALAAAAAGEPRRFDVCVARLRGLELTEHDPLAALPDAVVAPPAPDLAHGAS